jgi:hypothetical protein
MPRVSPGLWAGVVVLFVCGLLVGCSGKAGTEAGGTETTASTASEGTGSTERGTTTTTVSQTSSTGVTNDGSGTTSTTRTASTTATTTVSTTPTLGDLIASPDNIACTYIPHGSLSGADQLTVLFHIVLTGANPSQLTRLVAVNATSNTGLSTSLRSGVSNRGATPVQLDLRPSDFGRSHSISITVDAPNEVRETDESNNRIRVDIPLPSPRPDRTIDPVGFVNSVAVDFQGNPEPAPPAFWPQLCIAADSGSDFSGCASVDQ